MDILPDLNKGSQIEILLDRGVLEQLEEKGLIFFHHLVQGLDFGSLVLDGTALLLLLLNMLHIQNSPSFFFNMCIYFY